MSNVLQTDPYIFVHVTKLKSFKWAYPPNLEFFLREHVQKTKIGACIKIHQYITFTHDINSMLTTQCIQPS